MNHKIDLNKYYQILRTREIHPIHEWPIHPKHCNWGESYSHPLTAVIFMDLRHYSKMSHQSVLKSCYSLQLMFYSIWTILQSYPCYVEKQTGDGLMIVYALNDPNDYLKPLALCKDVFRFLNSNLNPYLKKDNLYQLSLSIGIEAGPVLMAKVGLPYIEQHFMLYGEIPNIASHLSDLGENVINIGINYKKLIDDLNPDSKLKPLSFFLQRQFNSILRFKHKGYQLSVAKRFS